ncbi:cellulase-like protein [hydrothermal vent metagenome]|uniref:Cellulase-like protein n=1 Tax=hydrothermal vent metagenome TaxID=652676 RepID=A0A3B0S612_9ZZZZ
MIKQVLVAASLLLASAALAQDDNNLQGALEETLGLAQEDTDENVTQNKAVLGTGAVLRGLDKVDGQVTDMTLPNGMVAEIGRLSVELKECRYPADDSISDAYAFMTIRDITTSNVLFSGWMLASSPALNALEHPRYDVWVLRCKTE